MKTQLIIHPEELSKKWIDRVKQAGVDCIGIHPWGGKKSVQSIEELLSLLNTAEYRSLIDYAKSLGIEIEYELHAAGHLLPRGLFDVHPEYFRMNKDGKRSPDWNFCVSNADARSVISKNAAKLADALYGSSERFYFWMDDARESNCNCDDCKKLSPSDVQLTVVNLMLREIKKKRPDAKMAYLAYQDTIPLPQTTLPENGVFLEYAPFEKYTAKGENRDMLIKRERDMLRPLIEFFGGETKLLEYWYDNSYLSGWQKPPKKFAVDTVALARDMAEYKKFGFDTVSSFACFLGEDYEELYDEPDITDFTVEVKRNG